MATLSQSRSHGRYGYAAPFRFPGCVVEGPTLDNVIAEAKEALPGHIQQLLDGNQRVCAPTAAEAIERGDALLLAAIDVPDDLRAVQIDVAIPALALARIDSFAQRHGLSRAALFTSVDRWATGELRRAIEESPRQLVRRCLIFTIRSN
jgi:predicted RNase H-like HicB family nuclease